MLEEAEELPKVEDDEELELSVGQTSSENDEGSDGSGGTCDVGMQSAYGQVEQPSPTKMMQLSVAEQPMSPQSGLGSGQETHCCGNAEVRREWKKRQEERTRRESIVLCLLEQEQVVGDLARTEE